MDLVEETKVGGFGPGKEQDRSRRTIHSPEFFLFSKKKVQNQTAGPLIFHGNDKNPYMFH